MTSTEETPLLTGTTSISDPEILKHDLLYQRFSPSQKRTIVALISYAAVIPCEYSFRYSLSRGNRSFTEAHPASLGLWVVYTLYP